MNVNQALAKYTCCNRLVGTLSAAVSLSHFDPAKISTARWDRHRSIDPLEMASRKKAQADTPHSVHELEPQTRSSLPQSATPDVPESAVRQTMVSPQFSALVL